MKRVKIILTIVAALLELARPAAAQPVRPAPTNDASQAFQKWVNDNFGGATLEFPYEIDSDQVNAFINQLQDRFQATNIYDLGALRAVAAQILPVLQQFEETEPYAAWLQARLDDMEAANEMQRALKAEAPRPGAPFPSVVPPMKLQKSVWVRRLSAAAWPPLAKTYVPKLKPIFVSENVPPALVWVAGVESSFEPKARSPAGAAGMFQLMPATARTEHLALWPFDQRYQPEKSARAAARWLRELHRRYGDWPLALAAYNVGPGRVDELLKRHKPRTFEGIARWLPAETQLYVPKVEATVLAREGLALGELRPPRG